MAVNRIQSATDDGAAVKAAEPAGAAVSPGRGGLKAWLPLAANLVLMPALAYATITFFVPRGEGGTSDGAGTSAALRAGAGEKEKVVAPLSSKILVNVAGTMGSRYLLANLSLVSHHPDLRALVERSDAELRDAAAGILGSKTIIDLEKPGARNLIRTELISVFNNVLGQGVVTEIYMTEFAIQ